jgi:peptidoglycan/LPS O-acetylase OafA/YrhL
MSDVLVTSPAALPQPVPAPTPDGIDPPKPLPPRGDAPDRLLPLDGWRGISILAVLACHLLPLGPKSWDLNAPAGLLGMSLFFTLSGFLITSMLLRHMDLRAFFIRRACRILPVVLVFSTVALLILRASPLTFLAHDTFLINYWNTQLTPLTGHLWSICVEIHFYLFIGLLCLLLRRAAFWLLPILCLAVTALRIGTHTYDSIVTHLRVDEILSGAWLALLYTGYFKAPAFRRLLSWQPVQPLLAIALLCSCHPLFGPLNYARPYFAAALVGSSLLQRNALHRFLANRPLAYIATISYALYIWHPLAEYGWLGSGDTLVKYAKRPLCFLLSFGLAHLSTFYFEKYWIALGRQWSKPARPAPRAADFALAPAASLPPR